MWNPIERKECLLTEMANLPEDIYPTVDVVITCCSEPVDIVEGTLCAALSLKYPQRKLKVYLCDDGARDEIRTMCQKVRKQARSLDIHSEIRYIARRKAPGIPHHAKAGNINHTLSRAILQNAEPDVLTVTASIASNPLVLLAPELMQEALGNH